MDKITLNNTILPLVKRAEYTDTIPQFLQENRQYKYHTLIYISKGNLKITESDTEYIVSGGTILYLKKNIPHTITDISSGNIGLYYVAFDMNDATHTADSLEFTVPKLLEQIYGSVLEDKLKDYIVAFNDTQRTLAFNLDVNIRFYNILSECIKFNRDHRSLQTKLSDEITNYLQDYAYQPLNTKDMEKRFYLTYKYMGTVYKKDTGFTILQYHTNLRMNHALSLLKTTLYSIDEISRQLGYTDPLYFSRVFKKHYGESPQTYRTTHTQ